MIYKAEKENLENIIRAISGGIDIFALEKREKDLHLIKTEKWDNSKLTIDFFRPVEPLKSIVFKPRESVGNLIKSDKIEPLKERIVIGIKNCDLSALKIHDYVFLADPADPFYQEKRDKTIIVSSDCTDCKDVCFCTAVKEQPYPKEGFDINISTTSLGYVIETGSAKGEKTLNLASQYVKKADNHIIEERNKNREAMYKKVEIQAKEIGLDSTIDYQKAIKRTLDSDLWDEFAKDCVECGACNLICCTCHCFIIADGTIKGEPPSRIKQWDSCLYLNFARVAGGANPRKHRAERLYNRFDKKFNFFPQILGRYACDGCGRCAEACTGKIDIRNVLKKASDE